MTFTEIKKQDEGIVMRVRAIPSMGQHNGLRTSHYNNAGDNQHATLQMTGLQWVVLNAYGNYPTTPVGSWLIHATT
ncbi:hypothetical protein T265_08646 [Opisthorchis viverrini]|uniref:Uncharacterized protein n=1 Tax=Opisthorchis viverrini TaxID=6198 RepID=A0A074ZCW7_OPIVI|nr:hypothetical protein T265_08646 [Opisthorchis viverrini]KER23482.1 hypothetical protein T265_08646 [Opisthorchis viverrini]